MGTLATFMGGATRVASGSGNFQVDSRYRGWRLRANVGSLKAILPDARLLPLGHKFAIYCDPFGTFGVAIADNGGTSFASVLPSGTPGAALLRLVDNSTAAGQWSYLLLTATQGSA
jgi:hypothetical protein